MKITDITVSKLLEAYARNKYKLYLPSDTKGSNFSLNIGGIRTVDNKSGKYSDFIYILRKSEKPRLCCEVEDFDYVRTYQDGYILDIFAATTKPGIPNLLKPVNPKGAAVVVPGQYIDVWSKGLHKGKYPALVQTGTFQIYRDNNKDSIVDYTGPKNISKGDGINCHHGAINKSLIIGLYSAGCQVHMNAKNFEDIFMWTIDNAIKNGMSKFTYTLFEEKDII